MGPEESHQRPPEDGLPSAVPLVGGRKSLVGTLLTCGDLDDDRFDDEAGELPGRVRQMVQGVPEGADGRPGPGQVARDVVERGFEGVQPIVQSVEVPLGDDDLAVRQVGPLGASPGLVGPLAVGPPAVPGRAAGPGRWG